MDSSMDMGATRMDTKSIAERVVTSLTLPWLVSITLLGFLAVAGGLWNLVANTRVLNLMIEGGVVRFHDKQIGPIDGVPELKYFIASQDPIAWPLLALALVCMACFWLLKGLQLGHLIKKASGSADVVDSLRLYSRLSSERSMAAHASRRSGDRRGVGIGEPECPSAICHRR